MKNKKHFTFRIFPDGFCEKRVLFADREVEKEAIAAERPEKAEAPVAAPEAKGKKEKKIKAKSVTDKTTEKIGILKKEISLPTIASLKKSKTNMKKHDFLKQAKENKLNFIEEWKLNVKREDLKIDPKQWNPTNEPGLKNIHKEFKALNLDVNNVFYQNLFAQLNEGIEKQKSGDPGNRKFYRKPEKYLAELKAIDGTYAAAYEYFMDFRNLIEGMVKGQQAYEESLSEVGKDPLSGKIVDSVKKTVEKIKKAIKDGDYATAGMYAVGIYAIYKTFNILSEKTWGTDNKPIEFKKWFFYGAAAYCGNALLKNAGIDVLEKIGFKAPHYELEGTPMGNIAFPKTLDSSIIEVASDLYLKDLHGLYKESHQNKIKFIDPVNFPGTFDAYSDKQMVGEQLYLLMEFVKGQYEDLVDLQGPNLPTFEEALNDPILSNGKLWHLLSIIDNYSLTKSKNKLFSTITDYAKESEELIQASLPLGVSIKMGQPDENDHFTAAEIKGFPVKIIFDEDKQVCNVYFEEDYSGAGKVGGKSMEISLAPRSTEIGTNIENVTDKIDAKMQKMFEGLKLTNKKVEKLEFANGRWTAGVVFPAFTKLGINDTTTSELKVTISSSGDSIDIPGLAEHPGLKSGVQKLLNQSGFESLKVLYPGLLHMEEADPENKNDYGFNLYVGEKGKKNLKLELVYHKGKKVDPFVLKDTRNVASLLQNPEFAQIYAEAISKTKDVTETFDKLHKLIDFAPEEFHITFVKELSKWVTDFTLQVPWAGVSTELLSGSVEDYYAHAIIDYKKDFIIKSLENNITSCTSFTDLDSDVASSFQAPLAKLEGIANSITEEHIKLGVKKWTPEDFMSLVIEPIKNSNLSAQYITILNDFENDIVSSLKLGKSDVFKEPHLTLNKLRSVFTYYTAHLNNSVLDSLSYPYKSGSKDNYYKVAYFKDVKEKIRNKAITLKTDNIPPAGSQDWDVMSFDDWVGSAPSVVPYNPLDEEPPLNDKELSEKLKEEIDKMVGLLKSSESNLKPSVLDPFITIKKLTCGKIATDINSYSSKYSDQFKAVDQYVYDLKVEIYSSSGYWQDYSAWEKLAHKISSI